MEEKKRISIEEKEYIKHRALLFSQRFYGELRENNIRFCNLIEMAFYAAAYYLSTYGIDAPFRSFFDVWYEITGDMLETLKFYTEINSLLIKSKYPDYFPYMRYLPCYN